MYTVSQINDEVAGNTAKCVTQAEKKYRKDLLSVAERVCGRNAKIVMLAGPSASGKTTTAHILCDMLISMGCDASVISLDNFYLSGDAVPKTEEGNPDFETVYSLDIEAINNCIENVINGKDCCVPVFNFDSRERTDEIKTVSVTENSVIIVEGLHALNPLLCKNPEFNAYYKIYIGTTDDIVDSEGLLLYHKDIRLVRRLSRDILYRGTSATMTLDFWKDVVKGEEKYLKPFKGNADSVLDTFHKYELCVYRDTVIKMLGEIAENSKYSEKAQYLIRALERFVSVPQSAVPWDSLLREFIPGGRYENKI